VEGEGWRVEGKKKLFTLYCCRCEKTVGDVQVDLIAEFGVRDNVV